METLYKLKKHILFLDEERNGISFIKGTECDTIIFESEKSAGIIVEFDWKIYRMRDFKVEKAQYEENGEGLILTYISSDRKIIIKEEFFYASKTTLARRVVIKPRYKGVIKEVSIAVPKLKTAKGIEMEIITPFLPRVTNRVDSDIDLLDTPDDSSGVFLVNSLKKEENCAVWFYSEYRFESGYINREITYKIKEKKELDAKEEIIAGIEFFSFYQGNYLENLENIEKFFRDKKNLPVLYDKNINGEENKFFGKMLHYHFKGKIESREILKWLKIENAVLGKKISEKFYGYSNRKEKFYTEKQKESFLLLSAIIGNVNIEEEKYKYISNLREKDEIIKNGIIVFDKIKSSSYRENISFIKKYRGSFYLIFFNFSPFAREIDGKFEKVFAEENIKGNRYALFNVLTGKAEGTIFADNKIELQFKGYETKILKLESVTEDELSGEKAEFYEEDKVLYVKNSFFEALFLEERSGLYKLRLIQGEKAAISGIKVNINGEKFKIKKGKNRVVFESENVKMSYLISEKNYIDFKIEGNFESAGVIFDMNRAGYFMVDSKYIDAEVLERENFSEIKYFDNCMVKFEKKKDNCLNEITVTKESLKLNFSGKDGKKVSSEIRISLV